MTGVTLRPVRPHDLPQVGEMMLRGVYETAWKTMPVQVDGDLMLKNLTQRLLTNQDMALFVATEQGCLVGLCFGEVCENDLLPGHRFVRERAWYVDSAHRESPLAARLLLLLFHWGTRRGAVGGIYAKTVGDHEELHWRYWGKP